MVEYAFDVIEWFVEEDRHFGLRIIAFQVFCGFEDNSSFSQAAFIPVQLMCTQTPRRRFKSKVEGSGIEQIHLRYRVTDSRVPFKEML